MLRFNRCPRCKGTLVLDKDLYGWYEECIQCGYLHDIERNDFTEKLPVAQHEMVGVYVRNYDVCESIPRN